MGEHIEKKVNAMGCFFHGEEYSKRYNVFLEKSQQNRRELENIRCYLPSALQALHTLTDECRVLSIGCGNGEVDFKVLKIIRGVSQKKIYCRLIEPNEYSLDKCKKRLANKDGMEFDINKPRTFQNYMAEQKSERGLFDVVHFIHSIYFMDFEEALTHCYENEMRESGIIMCVTGKNLSYKWRLKFNFVTRYLVFSVPAPYNDNFDSGVRSMYVKCFSAYCFLDSDPWVQK